MTKGNFYPYRCQKKTRLSFVYYLSENQKKSFRKNEKGFWNKILKFKKMLNLTFILSILI